MAWTQDQIRTAFGPTDYARGLNYFRQGRVQNMDIEKAGDLTEIRCKVRGTRTYDVRLLDTGESMRIMCSCPQFARTHQCKHVVAAMLQYGEDAAPKVRTTDTAGNQLLQAYKRIASGQRAASGRKAMVIPVIRDNGEDAYPQVGLRVAYEGGRPYVVKNVEDFLDRVARSVEYSYGKQLTLDHNINVFNDKSQQLIHLLMEQFPKFRSTSDADRRRASWYAPSYSSYGYGYGYGSDKNFVTLTGDSFNQFFDIMRGTPVDVQGDPRRTLSLEDGAPKVDLTVNKREQGADIVVNVKGTWTFFGNMDDLYALGYSKLLRCPPDFKRDVYPLVENAVRQLYIAAPDLPTFCGYVMPAIQKSVEVSDPESVLEDYTPSEGTALFYFDIEGETLIMRLGYRYGDEEIDLQTPPADTPEINRDLRSEHVAQEQAERWLDRIETPQGIRYVLEGDDNVIPFLTDDLNGFNEFGEVFVSDRLKAKRIYTDKAVVGVSVADGLLSLNIDTGEFPPDELEALYSSLLKKRKYHRLADGRFVTLDGSALEPLAEMAHMLRIPGKDVKDGSVQLPAFRAPYVSDLLENSENIEVVRDREFRALVRNFKTVRDSDYQVPDNLKGVLRGYQRTGFQWLKTLEQYSFGGILADEMGLGKTAQMIAFLSTVKNADKGAPSLVVCPASLILNWGDEFEKFAPDLDVRLIMGAAAERKKMIAESGGADVWVTSYELLRQDVDAYKDLKFYTCILDEAQHVKNSNTLASRAVKQINCERRFVMTGTPIENRLSEMWNLFDFLMPGYLYTHGIFMEKLEKPIIRSENKEATEQLRRLVRPFMLRRLKKEVLKELPPKIDYVRRVPLTPAERKVYLAEAHDAKESILSTGDQSARFRTLAALTRLREICCAPQLVFENYKGADSKLDACMDLVEGMVENGHQILLFSQFTSMLDLIRERLDKAGITSYTLQGSTPKKKRAELVKAFNAGGANVFLISLKAGGTGLNLTAADVVIHYDPWWNQAAQDQATDRAHRIGQKSSVQVYKLIAEDTVEEKILKLQEKKAGLLDMVSEEGGEGILSMSKEDMLALFD